MGSNYTKEDSYYDELHLGGPGCNLIIAGGVTELPWEGVLNNIFSFASTAVDICLGLIRIMAFFCGLMKVMEDSDFESLNAPSRTGNENYSRRVPADRTAQSTMALYFAANILGIGNAATRFGLNNAGYGRYQTRQRNCAIITHSVYVNGYFRTTSITLIPVTAIDASYCSFELKAQLRSSPSVSLQQRFPQLQVSYSSAVVLPEGC